MKALERMELMINETLDLKGVPATFREHVIGAALASVSLTEMRALLAVAKAVGAFVDATCESESAETDDYTVALDNDECAGNSHWEGCPVERAKCAMIDAYKALEEIP